MTPQNVSNYVPQCDHGVIVIRPHFLRSRSYVGEDSDKILFYLRSWWTMFSRQLLRLLAEFVSVTDVRLLQLRMNSFLIWHCIYQPCTLASHIKSRFFYWRKMERSHSITGSSGKEKEYWNKRRIFALNNCFSFSRRHQKREIHSKTGHESEGSSFSILN